MSGGSWNYASYQIDEASVFMARWDVELADLLGDLANVCHDCEWADSSDISPESARKSIAAFKKKWFGEPRDERLKGYVDVEVGRVKADLYALLGVDAG